MSGIDDACSQIPIMQSASSSGGLVVDDTRSPLRSYVGNHPHARISVFHVGAEHSRSHYHYVELHNKRNVL